jgi:hypothetical protein
MDQKLEQILEKVAQSSKGDWHVYNDMMQELREMGLTPEEYREAQRQIIEILEV